MDLRVFRDRTTFLLGAIVGVGDTLANVFFARGIESGYASLAVTGTGMYPIIPAVLGMIALGERIAPNQLIGIGLLVLGLVALGAVS
jgi:uncharacterized membrane protein